MQGYSMEHQDYVYHWIETARPSWFGGIVAGPSSPPLAKLRTRLPSTVQIRDYPDITHSVRCQFPVPYWDPAFAFTLGKGAVIEGWDKGLVGMKAGGYRKVRLSPHLAYRDKGIPELIPSNAVLVVEIWLRAIAQERTVPPS